MKPKQRQLTARFPTYRETIAELEKKEMRKLDALIGLGQRDVMKKGRRRRRERGKVRGKN